ncbi:MAG: hypothetical protein HRT71_03740 [Flavobacteriales bacterium]|nr:hypothetical protein [Flavobacteriales bacterium]
MAISILDKVFTIGCSDNNDLQFNKELKVFNIVQTILLGVTPFRANASNFS